MVQSVMSTPPQVAKTGRTEPAGAPGQGPSAPAPRRARSFLDAELALALRLSNLLVRHGEPAADGGCMLPFRLSQEDLGSLIGVTREAVGRVLRKWANEGWVDLGYARMVVRDPGALRRLLLPLGEGAPDTSAPLSPSPARAGR